MIGYGDIFGGLGALASVAGGFLGASGAQQAGAAQAAAYTENAASAGLNAGITRFNQNRDQQRADYLLNRTLGTQQAAYAGSGVAADTGSPQDVLGDTEQAAKFEAMSRFYAGDFAAEGGRLQADYDIQAAAAARKAASTSATSSILGGIGSAVGILGKFFL